MFTVLDKLLNQESFESFSFNKSNELENRQSSKTG